MVKFGFYSILMRIVPYIKNTAIIKTLPLYKTCTEIIFYLPSACAQSARQGILALNVDLHSSCLAESSKPTVSKRPFTPQSNAVAHAPESPTWLSVLYVCKRKYSIDFISELYTYDSMKDNFNFHINLICIKIFI